MLARPEVVERELPVWASPCVSAPFQAGHCLCNRSVAIGQLDDLIGDLGRVNQFGQRRRNIAAGHVSIGDGAPGADFAVAVIIFQRSGGRMT